MREKDQLLSQEIMKKHVGQTICDADNTKVTKEPEIDIMRRKWEEQTQKLAEKANIHYQHILFDEARAHGVGYYAFSQDEEQRAKQQENLANLRKDTEQKQKQIKELKDLKGKMEQNRLRAARIRQRIRAGLPAEPEEDLQNNFEDINNDYNSAISDVNTMNDASSVKINETSQDDSNKQDISTENTETKEEKIKKLEELIKNNKIWREMSQEEWVYKCRKERNVEFAPTYDNVQSFDVTPQSNSNTSDHIPKSLLSDKNEQNNIFIEQSVETNTNIPLTSYPCENYEVNNTPMKTFSNDIKNQSKQYTNNPLSKSINEEEIAAGLRYLREKYEQSQNQ